MKNIALIFAAALILSACQTTAPKECTRKDIVPPKELRQPSVQYPPASQNDGEEGTVTLLLAVQTDGSISDIRIARRRAKSAPQYQVTAGHLPRQTHCGADTSIVRIQNRLMAAPH